MSTKKTLDKTEYSFQTRQGLAIVLPHRRLDRVRPLHLGRRLHRLVLRPPVRQRHDLPVGRLHDRRILLIPHHHATCQGLLRFEIELN